MSVRERRTIHLGWQLVAVAGATAALLGSCSSERLTDQGSLQSVAMDATTACSPGHEGCPCSSAGTKVDCGQLVRSYGDYVTCAEGASTCLNGTWSACQGNTVVTKSLRSSSLGSPGIRVLSVTSPCADPCDPYQCTQIADGPGDVPDGAPVLPTEGGVTILPAGPCTGLQCQVDRLCGTTTMLTGRVYDPAGNNPLFGASVYIPLDPDPANLPVLAAGATCDACAGASPLAAVAVTQTDADGNFTLSNVPTTIIPPNNPIPLVVQLGKWRRVTLLDSVPPCQTTAVPADSSRLPRNQTDGYGNHADMPQVAFVSGSQDPFECMLLNAGIDPNEFGSSATNPNRRFHYYNSPDSPGRSLDPAFGSVVTGDALWNNTDPTWKLSAYDVVILACEGAEYNVSDRSLTGYTNLVNYADAGGRVFMTHFSYVWMRYSKSWNFIPASWVGGTTSIDTQDPLDSTVVTAGFPKGQSFDTWLGNVGALDAKTHQLEIHQGRQDTAPPLTQGVQPWLDATDATHGGSAYSPAFTFETPLDPAAGGQCGRAVFTDFHVATSAQVSGGGCQQSSDCGYGSTCASPVLGVCQDAPCTSPSDCGDLAWSCRGAQPGTCQRAACDTTCASGQCVMVGVGMVCGCETDSDCGVNGSCNAATSVCTVGSCTADADCVGTGEGSDATCQGATAGTCAPNACTATTQCAAQGNGGQEQCNGADCGGCRSNLDCPGGAVCAGASAGVCSGGSTNFPYECARGPLDPQEAALEFLFFDLSSCVGPAQPPQGIITFHPASFTVDFPSSCPLGTSVRWRELDWKATIPDTAAIVFAAQTAPAAADGGVPDYTNVQSVQLADAVATTPGLPDGWSAALIDEAGLDATGAGAFNTASPPVASAQDLRLTITLDPTTDQLQTPTLLEWQVKSDCPPTE